MKYLYSFFLTITACIWIPLLIFIFPLSLLFIIPYFIIGYVTPVKKFILTFILFKTKPIKKYFWKFIYNKIASKYDRSSWTCMNYGFSKPSGIFIKNNTSEIYCLQLYHYITSGFLEYKDWKGKSLVEVGSGRGGGLSYIAKVFSPVLALGIDISQTQVDLCNSFHKQTNIKFIQGDAENLPVKDFSIDVVVNIESSHCYPNINRFLSEIRRILKPGGWFLYADFANPKIIQDIEIGVVETGMKILKKQDITENVLMSMDIENERKVNEVVNIPWPFKQAYLEFSGVKDSVIYKEFQSRNIVYVAYVIQSNN
ncbi:hypothetical protein SteCoe_9762 [Stentor coeruleus]|uniref:Methyltransferase type 11 domain-containing protein n=1 Tax=Stentor coeruleus TaxID=5963 RepID=A0A1R2CH64_9CILI|nr:hypothetical protein SteCoe_9762 [Stentor coeruleus]